MFLFVVSGKGIPESWKISADFLQLFFLWTDKNIRGENSSKPKSKYFVRMSQPSENFLFIKQLFVCLDLFTKCMKNCLSKTSTITSK